MSEVARNNPAWRKFATEVARDTEERVEHSGDLDEKMADPLQATRAGVPVEFVDDRGNPTTRVRGPRADVVRGITQKDVENYANAPTRVCGECRHFQLREGRREIVKQKFLQRLVLEESWKMAHLGAPADHLGVCGQKPSMVTSTIADAGTCPGFSRRRG
jgi:hypothetical protein